MALTKKPAVVENEVLAAGGFEDVDANEQGGETEAANATAPSTTDKVKVEAATAIAKAQNTAVGTPRKFETALQSFENALPPVDFGVLPRLKGSNGLIMDGDNAKLGSKLQMTLISFNDQYVITPGSDEVEATKLVRYSLDGLTIDSTGETVASYINKLKTVDGYPDADMKKYCELVGILNTAEKDSEHVGNMVQISLSPQSRKSFEAYRLQRSVKIRMGREVEEGSEELTVTAVVKTMGNYTFTILQVSDK